MSPGARSSAEMSRVSPPRTARASAESMLRIEFERLLRAAFLEEAKQRVQDDDREDDRGVEPQAQHQLDEARGEQDVDEDVVELGEEPLERPLLLALRQAVRTVGLQTFRGFGGVQTAWAGSTPSRFSTSSAVRACQGAGSEPDKAVLASVILDLPRKVRARSGGLSKTSRLFGYSPRPSRCAAAREA